MEITFEDLQLKLIDMQSDHTFKDMSTSVALTEFYEFYLLTLHFALNEMWYVYEIWSVLTSAALL